MVQFNASSWLLLVAVIAGCTQNLVVAREYAGQNQLSAREIKFQERFIRAVAEELVHRRSLSSQDSELESRQVEDIQERSPESVTGFFKHIGEFVKRTVSSYWNGMKEDIGILDFRKHKRHSKGKDSVALREVIEKVEARHMESLPSNFRERRRRFGDNHIERRSHERHSTYRERRRRFVDGHMAQEYSDTQYRQRTRRRFDNGHIARSSIEARNHISGSDYHQRRRRFEDGHIVTRNIPEEASLNARVEDGSLLPRMSWFGKALLIYRDVGSNPSAPTSDPQPKSADNPIWNRVKRNMDELD